MQKKLLISIFGASALLLGCPADEDGATGSGNATADSSDDDDGSDTEPTSASETNPTTDPSAGSDTDPTDPSETDPTDPSETDPSGETDPTDPTAGTDTDETTNPTGIGFIEDPDGGGVSIECSVWDQDCPDGQKCAPWANDGGNAWNATKCVPVNAAPNQPGDSCTVEGSGVSGLDDCDVSSMCWDVDGKTNMGTCVAFCTGSESNPLCDSPLASCSIANEGVLILCLPVCDPLLQDCADGSACYGIDDAFVCAPDASGEMGVDDDPCEFINACDPGLGCFNAAVLSGCAGAGGCCSPFCDVTDPNTCAGAGEECIAYFEAGNAPPGYEDVGFCGIPA